MKMETIKKAIDIEAPKEKVWDVLLQDAHTRTWYAEFGAGVYADTDWKEGSKALFVDSTRNGLASTVIVNKPAAELALAFTGVVVNGEEEYESDPAKAVQGGQEIYRLSGQNGTTHLDISVDTAPEFFEWMSSAWDKALIKIKTIAETLKESD